MNLFNLRTAHCRAGRDYAAERLSAAANAALLAHWTLLDDVDAMCEAHAQKEVI